MKIAAASLPRPVTLCYPQRHPSVTIFFQTLPMGSRRHDRGGLLPFLKGEIMQSIKTALWALFGLLTAAWLIAEPDVFAGETFFALRNAMVQYSGILAIACMSAAMILALRPRWPEAWFGGLDKMYRLHKWLGIGALVLAVVHWLWAQGPKWAVGFGLLERPQRGPRPVPATEIEAALRSLRGTAEGIGEWGFYVAVALMGLALVKWFPYRLFFKTHRILAAVYLVMVFHAVVLTDFGYWTSPIGLLMAPMLAAGSWGAVVVLLRRVAAARQVEASITGLRYYPGVRVLETRLAVPHGWPGHKAGQFAFATADAAEGGHPYTIASAWNEAERSLTFIVKELGDHTRTLRDRLRPGQTVKVEGPYGCFTFDDDQPRQIWIGGGIGITPFVARMKELAAMVPSHRPAQDIDLFHTTAEVDEDALARLRQDAAAAGVRLHLLVDSRDGRLTGDRIRASVPDWRNASLWFCGPAPFGKALRADFATHGLPVGRRFHQELFQMR